jgi:hypothetical protein
MTMSSRALKILSRRCLKYKEHLPYLRQYLLLAYVYFAQNKHMLAQC